MRSLEEQSLNKFFSHIYIEKGAEAYPETQRIINFFPDSNKVEISHYKDVFCRKGQSWAAQKRSPSLILAVKRDNLIYPGAAVCQSFGEEHFFYTSSIMNCFYDCEYCYLQGMYSSGNMVIFVNTEDIFREVDRLLLKHPVYLCISYDTDLLAAERFTGIVSKWAGFALQRRELKVELRTKNADIKSIKNICKADNFIFAWTMSPDEIIKKYEHGTPPLKARVEAAKAAAAEKRKIRLCFDPLLYIKDFEKYYGNMFDIIFREISADDVEGISVGTFRISPSYLKNMRKQRLCELTAFPFALIDGVYNYDREINAKILDFALNILKGYISKEKIFTWGD